MSKIEKSVQQMIDWANDPSHGYDQIFRWGEKGDYDCSSSIIEALERAGIPAKSNGATYTGNMYQVLIKLGFKDVTSEVNMSNGSGVLRGDILLNHADHVAMSIGNGQLVQASINELGTVTGGQPGDQTGREFYIRDYYHYPWDCVLRYVETGIRANTEQKMVSEMSGDMECAARVLEDIVCRTGIGDQSPQAKLFPLLKKDALVDVVSGTKVVNEESKDREEWVLVRIAHPTEGFVREYVPFDKIGIFSTISS